MIRRLSIAVLAAAALAGCVTDGYYHGGSGDYYYGRPSVDYYYDGYGYGYPGGGYGYGGYYDYRYGYGYPYHGWYGGYWDYPYYYPPYRPRPPHHPRPDDDDGPRTGGKLPPVRDVSPPSRAGLPNTIARPSLLDGGRSKWQNPPPGGRGRLESGMPRARDPGADDARVRSPRLSAPLVPRSAMPAPPRVDSRPPPPRSVRSPPRERVSRPPASRERDLGQKVER